MNKEKIMDQLMDIRELTGGADNLATEKMINRDLFNIRKISSQTIEELSSKHVMPKVFDDWYKNDSTYGDPNTLKFKIIHFTVMAMWGGKGIESQERLCDWIKKAHKGKYTYDEERFVRCIEAIIHGYEVEK